MTDVVRIAMWSGPRNVSTALMRSFGARADALVVDEPLYAHYLQVTGLEHPGRAETLERHEADWRRVARDLTEGDLPEGKSVSYQKHMAHHLLDGMQGAWLDRLAHAFLLRDPRAMLASLDAKYPNPTLADTGLPQQAAIFDQVCEKLGETPPVVDAKDLLGNPRGILAQLCERLGLEFDEGMLSWEAGPRETDGAWAPYWYASVNGTTGFRPYQPSSAELSPALNALLDECLPLYEKLHAHRLQA